MSTDNRQRSDRSPASFVVGVGASAGGVEALQELFQALPSNSGLGFVVIGRHRQSALGTHRQAR
ncbi:chemotaxis protein CheB [Collinsella ihumii]|uniref:chemotaxis protein CheB n=1 Tax=Collinsella ihumii TaxID=1720204 RepID=UPI00338DF0D6